MLFVTRFVDCLANDFEVLLRRECAAIAFRRRAEGHVVQERLRGRANDCDDVRARERRGLRLERVVVDVAGRDDDVLVRPRRRFVLPHVRLARNPRVVDSFQRGFCLRQKDASDFGFVGSAVTSVQLGREREALRRVLHVLCARE